MRKIGQIRFLINDLAGSIKDYKKSVSIDASSIYAFIQLGVAQYKLGELEKSKRTFETAMKKFGDSHEVYNYYGEILLDQGKFDKAIEYLDKAIVLDPKSSLPYINKGNSLTFENRNGFHHYSYHEY
jgi:import receptor subunit TOM70